ncbi:MAG: hypothetical protein ABIR06_14665 [Cyclobacteriaceae bacterium]
MRSFNSWNRKVHIHIGLFLLLFIWLFSLSGLLLNHGNWKFASFWDQRQQKESIRKITLPNPMDSSVIISHIMQELEILGEVNNVKLTSGALDFRVGSPGRGRDLHVDLNDKTVLLKEYHLNIWGKIRTLHTFNGIDKGNISKPANWFITNVWRIAMDGIAIALILLCMSSWVMWYKIRKDYQWSAFVLIVGFLISLYFVYLIRVI